jgi:DNA-binding response OmpR family regulator
MVAVAQPMAERRLPDELELIPGELPDTSDPEDARQWTTVYRELVTFAERTLARLRSQETTPTELRAGTESDAAAMERHLDRLRSRLEFWEQRLWDLAGLDVDIAGRSVAYGRRRLHLTGREIQLLAFLARRPGRFYPASQLVALAWGTPELSSEQLRTYIVRLRRRLSAAGAPCRVVSEPRRGYGLVFTE